MSIVRGPQRRSWRAVAAERALARLGAGQEVRAVASEVATAMTALTNGGWSVTPQGGVR